MRSIASKIIEKCGGAPAVAKMTGVHVSRVHRWTYPPDRGGTGGLIPAKQQHRLLAAARQRGIDLSPADFFPDPEAPSGNTTAPAEPASEPEAA